MKLKTYVHVVESGGEGRSAVFGPDDRVPEWAAAAISNPDVWEVPPNREAPPQTRELREPPRGGPGSSAEAWAAFARQEGLPVPDGSTAREIQALWDDRTG